MYAGFALCVVNQRNLGGSKRGASRNCLLSSTDDRRGGGGRKNIGGRRGGGGGYFQAAEEPRRVEHELADIEWRKGEEALLYCFVIYKRGGGREVRVSRFDIQSGTKSCRSA